MRKLLNIIIGVVIVGLVGCVSNKVNSPNYPSGIVNVCRQQLELAKVGIEGCGSPLVYQSSLVVSVRKGTKLIDGMWCYELSSGYYIGGMTYYSRNVIIGCNPNNENDISVGVLFHEFGHYWLQSNYGIANHPAKYDSIFHWSWCDGVKGSVSTNEGSRYIIDSVEMLKGL